MTNYTWTIAALECATEENGLNKVVKTVHWRYKGTEETSIATEIERIQNPPIVIEHSPFAPKPTTTSPIK